MGIASVILKKVPVAGFLYGIGSGVYHVAKGDVPGAVMDIASGAAAIVPGWGTAVSLGIDVGHFAYDIHQDKVYEGLEPYRAFIVTWHNYLRSTWKIENKFAWRAAQLIVYCSLVGLNPIVTSGFRSPEYQAQLLARWNAGDRRGLRYKPALKSDHSKTDTWGNGASTAIDIQTNNEGTAAKIATMLGINCGYNYGDGVHFNT